MSLNILNTFK